MSATTQNDAFFIKTLEFPESAIRMPLSFASQKWSGEKMIIIPSLIGEELDKGYLRPFFAKSIEGAKYGRAILVPSFAQASIYSELGADVITKEDINVKIGNFRNGNFDVPIVLVNRYDGVDLPDDTCRVLVIDSMPFFVSLRHPYVLTLPTFVFSRAFSSSEVNIAVLTPCPSETVVSFS